MNRLIWYHVGHPVSDEVVLDLVARGLPAYQPTDPKVTNQAPYLLFLDRDTTPHHQKGEAR